MRRLLVTSMLIVATALTSGCHAGGSTGTATKTVDITMQSGHASSSGTTVHVAVGQQVQLQIKADHGGTLTLHTSPTRTFHYGMGTTLVPIGSFDAPGIVALTSSSATSSVLRIAVDGTA